jgi:hypothetical protein
VTKGRRKLSFANLSEVPLDIDRLAPAHRMLGRWSLAQVCRHIRSAMDSTMDGFPGPSSPMPIQTLIRFAMKTFVFPAGRLVEGVRAPAGFVPKPDLDLSEELSRLRATVNRFNACSGPFASHPRFGRLDRKGWERFHCIHCAHHLSFAVPTA